MAWLIQHEGPTPGASYPLGGRMVTIGRSEGNEVQVLDAHMSRRHAMVRFVEADYVVTDLSSRNGIFLNGKQVRREVLRQGDLLRIGNTVFRFSLLEADSTK